MKTHTHKSLRFPRAILAVVLGLVALAQLHAQPSRQWNQGNPTNEEQHALERLNAYRADPVGYLNRYWALHRADDVVNARAAYRSATLDVESQANGIRNFLAGFEQNYRANLPPIGAGYFQEPFVFYPAFQEQAARWNLISIPRDPLPPGRVVPAGSLADPVNQRPTNASDPNLPGWLGTYPFSGPNATGGTATYSSLVPSNFTENVHLPYSVFTAREYPQAFIPSGSSVFQQGSGLPNFTLGIARMVGLTIKPTAAGGRLITLFRGTSDFLSVSDLPFGARATLFVTGVIYQDKNQNGEYDPGEGLPNVTVRPDKGDWFAVTSASGGYTFPVAPNSGAYTLTLSGGPLQGTTQTVAVADRSMKVDFVQAADPDVLPPQTVVPAATGATQFIGLSTRGVVEQGSNALFGGFVIKAISGQTSAPKRLLIRGVGTTLAGPPFSFGNNAVISSAKIDIYSAEGSLLATNAGWREFLGNQASQAATAAISAASASVGLFPLTSPVDGSDAALIISLPPGGYTAVFSTRGNGLGRIGLLEIYDLTPTVGGRMINVATRGRVDTGIRQMIVGTTIAGTGTSRILVRGAGPTLGNAPFNVSGIIPNPFLTLFDNAGVALASNDDWSASPQTNQIRALAAANGAFPFAEGSRDAALLRLIGPGNYTAVVGSSPNTLNNGVAIIELYEAP